MDVSKNRDPEAGDAAPTRSAPKQQRSKETHNRILEAVRELLTEDAFDEAGISDIAAKAGCSVGGFYRRFASKDDALVALQRARLDALSEHVRNVLAPDGEVAENVADAVSAFVDVIVEHTLGAASMTRAYARREALGADAAVASSSRTNAEIFQLMRALLSEHADQHSHSDPDVATQFVIALIGGLTRDAVLYGAARAAHSITEQSFSRELKRAALNYLGAE